MDEEHVNIVETARGFTSAFDDRLIEQLEYLHLIRHTRDDYVMEKWVDGKPVPGGPLHRFYWGEAQ